MNSVFLFGFRLRIYCRFLYLIYILFIMLYWYIVLVAVQVCFDLYLIYNIFDWKHVKVQLIYHV